MQCLQFNGDKKELGSECPSLMSDWAKHIPLRLSGSKCQVLSYALRYLSRGVYKWRQRFWTTVEMLAGFRNEIYI